MHGKRFTSLSLLCFLVFLMTSSCQKDSAVNSVTGEMSFNSDSTNRSAITGATNNILAATGMLKIKIQDSVYSFDASRDSIAFINVNDADGNRYFGITAVNKEHTISFGISSPGAVYNGINSNIAGSQFLLNQQDDGQT